MEQDDRNIHQDGQTLINYTAGACSPAEKKAIEVHCLECVTCRAQLTVLINLKVALEIEDESRDWEAFLPLGREAAARARQLAEREEQPGRMPERVSSQGQEGNWVPLPSAVILGIFMLGGLLSCSAWWHGPSPDSPERLLVHLGYFPGSSPGLQLWMTGETARSAHSDLWPNEGPKGWGHPAGRVRSYRQEGLMYRYQRSPRRAAGVGGVGPGATIINGQISHRML